MQAVHVSSEGLRYLSNYPKPEAGPGEALIRLSLAGICSTDLEIVRGYAGFDGVLGHEFVGVVEACEESGWLGKRVVGSINLSCRRCSICLAGQAEHCPHRTVLGIIKRDGAFADYLTLPIDNLHQVPDGMADEVAVFTEPVAAAVRIREQVKLSPTAAVAVVGPGRLGVLVGQVLSLGGSVVTMIGRRPASLALPAKLGLKTGLIDEVPDSSFDFVVEATGNEAGFAESLRIARPMGTLILKSTFADRASIDLTKLVVAEVNVVGSRCGPFDPALRLLGNGAVLVQDLVEAEYQLNDALSAFEHAAQPGVRKILLRP